ncbi:hypothetical protein NLM24_19470 [Nocardia zapadnayensis]|uniref:hypothetical protein n=1 Tax=Nocardia rhamnosiphila TaxID=426716 RepID=UPI0022479683|nr:hypothetical protein [Nocardia zapadnayensis]MCX0272847.1 hypothetical protein [Nocardia zapadnayensis]
MSRNSITATMAGRHPSLAGIGQFRRADGMVGFEIGWPEVERDTVWARRLLEVWEVGPGDHALLTARNSEGPWFGPVVRAIRETGVVFSNAEPYAWDARRVTTLLSALPIKVVAGLSGEAADALLADGEAAARLAEVPVLWARGDAVEQLRRAGLQPAEMAMLGPVPAFSCPERKGLHIDPAEWRFTATADGLTLTVLGDRLFRGRDIDLDISGAIVETPCTCGLPGSRINTA